MATKPPTTKYLCSEFSYAVTDDHLMYTLSPSHPNCCSIRKPKNWLFTWNSHLSFCPSPSNATPVTLSQYTPRFLLERLYCGTWHLQLETGTNPTPRCEVEDLQKEEKSIMKLNYSLHISIFHQIDLLKNYHLIVVASSYHYYHFITPCVNSKVPPRIHKTRAQSASETLQVSDLTQLCHHPCHCSCISSCFKKALP